MRLRIQRHDIKPCPYFIQKDINALFKDNWTLTYKIF